MFSMCVSMLYLCLFIYSLCLSLCVLLMFTIFLSLCDTLCFILYECLCLLTSTTETNFYFLVLKQGYRNHKLRKAIKFVSIEGMQLILMHARGG